MARKSLEVLRRRGLAGGSCCPAWTPISPRTPAAWSSSCCCRGCEHGCARRCRTSPVTPTFLFALLLYGPIAAVIESMPPESWHELAAILEACDRAVREAQAHLAIPTALLARVQRDVRAAAASGASARPARAAPARAPALSRRRTTCCCCARSSAWLAGDGAMVDAAAGGPARGAGTHGGCARAGGGPRPGRPRSGGAPAAPGRGAVPRAS